MTVIALTDACPSAADLAFESIGQVRRASAKFGENRDDFDAMNVLNSYRRFRLNCVRTSLSLLTEGGLPERVLISARLKRLKSIYRKIVRNQGFDVSRMDDIIGFRVICRNLADATALAEGVRRNLDAGIKDYLAGDHFTDTGYRAIHGIVKFRQTLGEASVRVSFEIQIRTWYQHLWACWCEGKGEQAKEGFVGRTDEYALETKRNLREVSNAVKGWEEQFPGKVQEKLPKFQGVHNVAIASCNTQSDYFYDPYSNDVARAVQDLNRLETKRDIEALLLVGVAEDLDLQNLLKRTHPNFLGGLPLDPEQWMPVRD